MKILLWGLIIFFLSFFLHLVIWKIHLPKKQTKALLQIFFGILIMSILILTRVSFFKFWEYVHISLFFISLALAYVITYSAIEADSPSLVIIMNIIKTGQEGLDKGRLYEMMTDELLVIPRIRDLVNDKMVYLDKYKYKLTLKGLLFVSIFIYYRKLLNAEKGG